MKMEKLLGTLKQVKRDIQNLPFSIYTSIHEQKLLNVPISKPLLIVIISGEKELGVGHDRLCKSGQFIFLPDSPLVNMRNIPKGDVYFALLIEFSYQDFQDVPNQSINKPEYIIGDTTPALEQCLLQFVECAQWAPENIINARKKEILMMLYHMGFEKIASMMDKPKVSHQLRDFFVSKNFQEITIDSICEHLAMSESTLRRKLKSEDTSIQQVKDKARLSLGLHLLQTTPLAIGIVAEQCGYFSQSRFTDRFKNHFGLTPSELRKTQVNE